MNRRDRGFALVAGLLIFIIVAVLGLIGWCVWYTENHPSHLEKTKLSQSQAKNTKVGQPQSQPVAASDSTVTDFYGCVNKSGTWPQSKPYTCNYGGKTYPAPTVFDKSQIAGLGKVPLGVQPLVIAAAEQAFNDCARGGLLAGQPNTYLAQSNFVEEGVACDSGHREYFGLDSGTWHDLGGGQTRIDCEKVDKYHITQSSAAGLPNPETDWTCDDASGTSKQIPQ